MSDQDGTVRTLEQEKNSMTTLWLDSFDMYGDLDLLIYEAGNYDYFLNAQSSNIQARTGTSSCLFDNTSGGFIGKDVYAGDTIVVGIAFKPDSNVDRNGGIVICNGYAADNPLDPGAVAAGDGFKLFRTITGNLKLVSFSGAVETDIYESVGNEILLDTYTYIQLKLKNDAAGGTYQIRLNKRGILSSGLIAFALTFDTVFLAKTDNTGQINMDDYYIDDADFLGAQRCVTQFVATDQIPQDWSLSSGVNAFDLINDYIIDPLNYIQANTVGDKSNFGIAGLPFNGGNISAVRLCAVQYKTTILDADTQQTVRIKGVDYIGAVDTQSVDQKWWNDIITLNGVGVTANDLATMFIQTEKVA